MEGGKEGGIKTDRERDKEQRERKKKRSREKVKECEARKILFASNEEENALQKNDRNQFVSAKTRVQQRPYS